jgi:hypothetical protein
MKTFSITSFFLCAFLMCTATRSETTGKVPNSLFGVKLGAIYAPSEGNEIGDMPVKKITGTKGFIGQGFQYYFEPLKVNSYFPYIENKKNPEKNDLENSHKLYLLPIIPDSVTSSKELETLNFKYLVTSISWYDESKARHDMQGKSELEIKTKDTEYYWAMDMCKTLGADISVHPVILDSYADKSYECTFIENDRELKISNWYRKKITLAFKGAVFDKLNRSVETQFRKLKAKEILPR